MSKRVRGTLGRGPRRFLAVLTIHWKEYFAQKLHVSWETSSNMHFTCQLGRAMGRLCLPLTTHLAGHGRLLLSVAGSSRRRSRGWRQVIQERGVVHC